MAVKEAKFPACPCPRARDLIDMNRSTSKVRLVSKLVPAFSVQARQDHTRTGEPPKCAFVDRKSDLKSAFRTFYVRGDFPAAMEYKHAGNKIAWKEDIKGINYEYYLPIFFDGLCETKHPYKFFAIKGIQDLLANGGDKIVPVLPHLILPIKNALSTRKPAVICETLKVIQQLVTSAPDVGEELVPYFKQLLPHLNMYKDLNVNMGDFIEYSQGKKENIGDLVQDTLEVLEKHGGEGACVYIKHIIPTYESCSQRHYTIK